MLCYAGEFGIVYRGYLVQSDTHTTIAVKTLKGNKCSLDILILPTYLNIALKEIFESVNLLYFHLRDKSYRGIKTAFSFNPI